VAALGGDAHRALIEQVCPDGLYREGGLTGNAVMAVSLIGFPLRHNYAE
jgi:hypothetical protein